MRLIDADALMDDINNSLNKMTKIGIAVDGDWLWAKLNDALDNAPTIEPERKKGKWAVIRDADGFACGECSVCRMRQYEGNTDFCPNCGAEMERD